MSVTTWMMNLEDVLLSGINDSVQEDPLEEEMETHPSILAWRIPWLEEPGGLGPLVQGRKELDMTEVT